MAFIVGPRYSSIPGSADTTFNIGSGFNDLGNSFAIQPDNKILCVGRFSTYSGVSKAGIVRLNTDGSIDSTFNNGIFNATVRDVNLQNDQKIVIGGDFTTYSGVTLRGIVRLNTDSSIDNTFNIGTGFLNSGGTMVINQTVLQSDQKILVGGWFTSYNGVARNNIIRLNSDGSIDNTFSSGTTFSVGSVSTIAIQADNKILVGGSFTSYSGVTRNRIIRLNSDGTIDNTFNIGTGFNNIVYRIILQNDQKILVGGNFATYSGVSSSCLIRLNTDGSIDNTFNVGTGFNVFGGIGVYDILFDSTKNKIIPIGSYTTYNGVSANRIIRLELDGSIDATFYTGFGFDNAIYGGIIQSDGKILITGGFTTYYNNLPYNRIIRLVNELIEIY